MSHEKGQLVTEAARIYEEFFVPALFADWPEQLLAATAAQPAQRLLDVACGTGILARHAFKKFGGKGFVEGLDPNEGMLAVARNTSASIQWTQGRAEALPYTDGAFDLVLCQFGLMFFEDRRAALREMLRVLRPGGSLGIAVWAPLRKTPGYAAVAALLRELFDENVARSIEVPYSLGEPEELEGLLQEAGATEINCRTRPGEARFPSLEAWIHTDLRGWTLADVIDEEGYQRFRKAAQTRLAPFVLQDGSVCFEAPALIATARTSHGVPESSL